MEESMDVCKKQDANIALEKLQMLFSKEIEVFTHALLTSSLLCVLHNAIFHLWRITTAVSVERVRVHSDLQSLLLELFGDVCPRSVSSVTIHALVGGRTAQRTTGFAPRAEFHVGGGVEGIESIGQFRATTVPAGAQMGMRFAEEREEMEHTARIVVAAHQCGAGDGAAVLFNQGEPAFFGELLAVVAPKIGAVTTRTGTRAAREVHGEGHFVGEFLENDVVVDVFEHGGIEELTDMFVCVFSIFPRHAALTPLAGGTIRKCRREEQRPLAEITLSRV